MCSSLVAVVIPTLNSWISQEFALNELFLLTHYFLNTWIILRLHFTLRNYIWLAVVSIERFFSHFWTKTWLQAWEVYVQWNKETPVCSHLQCYLIGGGNTIRSNWSNEQVETSYSSGTSYSAPWWQWADKCVSYTCSVNCMSFSRLWDWCQDIKCQTRPLINISINLVLLF